MALVDLPRSGDRISSEKEKQSYPFDGHRVFATASETQQPWARRRLKDGRSAGPGPEGGRDGRTIGEHRGCDRRGARALGPSRLDRRRRARVGTPGTDGWLSAALPFSFLYGGRPSAELLPTWSRQAVAREEVGRTVLTVRLSDPATGLAVTWEATIEPSVPAVEWLLTFRNDGAADTALIENVRALDLVAATDHHELVVYHATGGIAAPDAFEPQQTVLPRPPASRAPGATGKAGQTEFRLAPAGGRSSNGVLPYFNVEANWDGARGSVRGSALAPVACCRL